ncbi:MAG TPA: hypothetical protein VFJ43_08475, partial [Bacteroidia bacterium]|nr:hypothetical protein [Bacteroidia bacterium]
ESESPVNAFSLSPPIRKRASKMSGFFIGLSLESCQVEKFASWKVEKLKLIHFINLTTCKLFLLTINLHQGLNHLSQKTGHLSSF